MDNGGGGRQAILFYLPHPPTFSDRELCNPISSQLGDRKKVKKLKSWVREGWVLTGDKECRRGNGGIVRISITFFLILCD